MNPLTQSNHAPSPRPVQNMIKARGILAVGAVAAFSVLIVWSVGGWSDRTKPDADLRSAKPNHAEGLAVDEPLETSQDPLSLPDEIKTLVSVEELPEALAVFRNVFWEPQDTTSLRALIRTSPLVKDKTILEIGTGSGLVALCCLEAGAQRVVATDINPMAVENAKFNARLLGLDERIDVRQVSETEPAAYAVIGETERFDLIISNPPWEDATPNTIGEYALYDSHFALMRSILAGLRDHLKPGGKALLAYGCVTAIEAILKLGDELDLEVEILDDRDLDTLPEVFLPGMLLSVKLKQQPDSQSKSPPARQ